jgi:transcriptional regulator with GAF, ATPase, and Fis domain
MINKTHVALSPAPGQIIHPYADLNGGRPKARKTSNESGLQWVDSAESTCTSPTIDDAQRAAIGSALKQSGGKIYGPGGAAELLDLKPSTLQSKIKKPGMVPR